MIEDYELSHNIEVLFVVWQELVFKPFNINVVFSGYIQQGSSVFLKPDSLGFPVFHDA
jgi:hypothetical protein